ncbi:acetoin utilization protein AcuC [Bacillus sonorensis]|uniref:Acetoin utilization protein AcuC n=2 Tax=Bacillus sonorensis TaxID=119858 RepID=M5PFF6_9BACI|nr:MULTISPECIES: acetoin utilization protein AcuC [Bacillus]TWK77201.1 Acetoin utilization protein AcuC [Bacillus paralicheniformis]ASB87898.1 Acetoin utilization protein AcuC [Bacillus sonorensis]EME75337.1 acetoin utilization protein AcuC [Bacillus sonorensis L12]MBG9915798.1 histone deacetylase [Bacillus sonorensis]MCF7617233.1 acetoin utilization protein AcuC [Bacillus sonorensis]
MKDCVFIFTPSYQTYQFHQDHPFNQLRVYVTYDLLNTMNAFAKGEIIAPRMASESELSLVHTSDYIKAVKLAGAGKLPAADGEGYGLGTEDTPVFAGMHEAASLLVGGTLTAADYVMTGMAKHALNLGGGLHHGFRGRASGFCIYNDSSVVIRYLQKNYHARVLYIDTDAHHGDGVQFTFYDDPSVCTVSIHETGRYLFPGTGQVQERGHGEGYGYAFNIPLDAFTEDQSFIDSYRTAVTEIAEFFKPDVILTQNGADAHFYDPLTHLCTTMRIYEEIPKLAHELAHKYCDGRWIAVGGGGYDIWRVVPRAWGRIWLEMKGIKAEGQMPEKWLKRWEKQASVPLSAAWGDPDGLYAPIPRKAEITEKNAQTVAKTLFPIRSASRST